MQCDEPICGCEPVGDEDACDAVAFKLVEWAAESLAKHKVTSAIRSLFSVVGPYSVGGWVQLGYHSNSAGNRFNSYADHLQLHQAWLYAERAIDSSNGWDIGGRLDYVYGTDGPDTQSFGTGDIGWDNPWDRELSTVMHCHKLAGGFGDLSVNSVTSTPTLAMK